MGDSGEAANAGKLLRVFKNFMGQDIYYTFLAVQLTAHPYSLRERGAQEPALKVIDGQQARQAVSSGAPKPTRDNMLTLHDIRPSGHTPIEEK